MKAPQGRASAAPNTGGLFRNRLFNEDASRNRAELEPIDNLTRSTAPHARRVGIALGTFLVAVAIWLTLGSIDHSLWLDGRLLNAPVAEAQAGTLQNVVRIETEVGPAEARALLAGRQIFVFQDNTEGTFSGTIHKVHGRPSPAGPDHPAGTLQLDVVPDPTSALVPSSHVGENYRLRVPVGSQHPIALLFRLATSRRVREQ